MPTSWAQHQEPSLVDRLLRPNMELKNNAQGKKFGANSAVIERRGTVGDNLAHDGMDLEHVAQPVLLQEVPQQHNRRVVAIHVAHLHEQPLAGGRFMKPPRPLPFKTGV